MASKWLQVRVELLGGGGIECHPPPGRIFLVGPRHTFEQLASAIDVAFARWDISHLHSFELADGRLIGFPDDDDFGSGVTWLDHAKLKVAAEVRPGEAFDYVFDLGDNWLHRCTVAAEKIDPVEEFDDPPPPVPVPIWGWGTIPDQYGRISPEEIDDD